jgi:NADPH-dependent 7-cyano-7-deazaguanine reductase QueF-like protein
MFLVFVGKFWVHVHSKNIVMGASFNVYFDSILVSTSSYIIVSR